MALRKTSKIPATVTLRMDAKTRKALQAEADERHMSESALGLLFIEEGLGRSTTMKRLDELEGRIAALEQQGQDPATEHEAPAETQHD